MAGTDGIDAGTWVSWMCCRQATNTSCTRAATGSHQGLVADPAGVDEAFLCLAQDLARV